MARAWSDVSEAQRAGIEECLRGLRRRALPNLLEMVTADCAHLVAANRISREAVEAEALKVSKVVEDAVDAALERLGFRP